MIHTLLVVLYVCSSYLINCQFVAKDISTALPNHSVAIASCVVFKRSLYADPLSSYPSAKQLSKFQVDRWHELGAHLGLTEDQLKRAKKRPQPTASVLIDAKINNIDLMWNKIVESLLRIGEYELAESICNEYGKLTLWYACDFTSDKDFVWAQASQTSTGDR